jgi:hypothetical protein
MNYLLNTTSPIIRYIIMIGDPSNPLYLLTNHEAPVIYSPWGTFQPSTAKLSGVKAAVGLEVQKATLTWTPGNLQSGVTVKTANPLQLARIHYFDNLPVRVWKCFMPTPGGILGACEWFGGRIADSTIGRNQIQFSVNSFLDVVTQKLPPNVIESTSTLAGFTAATRPAGDATQPTFATFTGSSTTVIYGDTLSPSSGHIYGVGTFDGGYMVFLNGPGATLGGVWSAIGSSLEFDDGNGNHHNQFNIYTPLPWAPTPTVDTFYVSTTAPINLNDGTYFGFGFVPQPTQAA